MPLLRLIAEGVGPFEHLDIDLSDGKGNPHPGPHIFAGVNGAGKSTLLRTLAWVMDRPGSGFQDDEWLHLLSGRARSRAMVMQQGPAGRRYVLARTDPRSEKEQEGLVAWVRSVLSEANQYQSIVLERNSEGTLIFALLGDSFPATAEAGSQVTKKPPEPWAPVHVAAYSPSKALKYLSRPDITRALSDARENYLAFESTVQERDHPGVATESVQQTGNCPRSRTTR